MQTLRKLVSFALVFALVAGAVVFAIGNQTPVPVYYVFGHSEEQPLWLVSGLAFLLGTACAWVVSLWLVSRAKLAERRHRKHAERLEAELHELRNLPLAGGHAARAEGNPVPVPAESSSSSSPTPPSGGG
jgi:uncharacterized membrane protein YciS (DUF1049 family)